MAPNCLGKRILRHTRVTAEDRGERDFRGKKAKKNKNLMRCRKEKKNRIYMKISIREREEKLPNIK